MKMSVRKPVAPSVADIRKETKVKEREGSFGTLPLPVGKLVTKGLKLTDKERETLLDAGWKEDEPLPSNIASILQQAKEKSSNFHKSHTQKKLDEWQSLPELGEAEIADIKELPEEEQDMVQDLIKMSRTTLAEMDTKKKIGGFSLGPKTEIIDDRPKARTLNTAPPPGITVKEIELEQPKEQVSAGADTLPKHCVNCGYDQAQEDPTNPTSLDKRGFLQTLVGTKRFVKRYALFDGALVVVYRNLLSEESEKCWQQVQAEINNGTLNGTGDIYSRLIMYRMVCGLESVTTASGQTSLPTLEEFEAGGSNLPEIVARVRKEILPNEHMWRAVGIAFAKFQRLTEKLEAQAGNDNFWQATE